MPKDIENLIDEFVFEPKEVYNCKVTKKIIIELIMAGGGSHWWRYEIEFGRNYLFYGDEYKVFIVSKDGRELRENSKLFINLDDNEIIETTNNEEYKRMEKNNDYREVYKGYFCDE